MSTLFWKGRRVFITGHTGFKGGWLSLWLDKLGAQVHGYSLPPPTEPNLFTVAKISDALASHVTGNVKDSMALKRAMASASPEIVFHLAAQPLVRRSYQDPIDTFETNVLGVVNLLEAVRACPCVRAVVNVTSDKCYANDGRAGGYREEEPLGGRDPYSSSKACSELITAAYRSSFFDGGEVAIATARAGNVIGGGDWAADRLVPDFYRAIALGRAAEIRQPESTRPWQHVLEPLAGYLMLAEGLCQDGAQFIGGWNFGPVESAARPVRWVLDELVKRVPNSRWLEVKGTHPHEANHLSLDSSKARNSLKWRSSWPLDLTLDKTVEWFDAFRAGENMHRTTLEQIDTQAELVSLVGRDGNGVEKVGGAHK